MTTDSIASSEFLGGIYGPTTAAAVQSYKDKRGIINFSYQKAADNIVGKMTIAALDQELEADIPSRLLCAPTEGPRIDTLLISLRPVSFA